jgi:hypothetical protein
MMWSKQVAREDNTETEAKQPRGKALLLSALCSKALFAMCLGLWVCPYLALNYVVDAHLRTAR